MQLDIVPLYERMVQRGVDMSWYRAKQRTCLTSDIRYRKQDGSLYEVIVDISDVDGRLKFFGGRLRRAGWRKRKFEPGFVCLKCGQTDEDYRVVAAHCGKPHKM